MNKITNKPASIFTTADRLWMAILLLNQRDTQYTLREFSALSGLSLGFVSKFSNLLKQAGFLEDSRHMRLKNPRALLDTIRDIYFFEKNTVHPYYTELTPEESIKKIKSIGKNREYAFTRMAGASQIAYFVRFQTVEFYVPSEADISFWKDALELTHVEFSGNINLIIPSDQRLFSTIQKIKGAKITNNIQLYLDLYKYPARGREQAEHLREKVIKT
ncbi:MAG: hypothetical protein HYU97_12280 [Deltaproteobacteria bacterium]|nr:hypothetical protein [Deltaproteobacteria bacterium]